MKVAIFAVEISIFFLTTTKPLPPIEAALLKIQNI